MYPPAAVVGSRRGPCSLSHRWKAQLEKAGRMSATEFLRLTRQKDRKPYGCNFWMQQSIHFSINTVRSDLVLIKGRLGGKIWASLKHITFRSAFQSYEVKYKCRYVTKECWHYYLWIFHILFCFGKRQKLCQIKNNFEHRPSLHQTNLWIQLQAAFIQISCLKG